MDKKTLSSFKENLSDPDTATRLTTIQRLDEEFAHVGKDDISTKISIIQTIAHGLDDEDETVRHAAIGALADRTNMLQKSYLCGRIALRLSELARPEWSSSKDVRMAAVTALGKTIPNIVYTHHLADAVRHIRAASMVRCLWDPDDDIRDTAASILRETMRYARSAIEAQSYAIAIVSETLRQLRTRTEDAPPAPPHTCSGIADVLEAAIPRLDSRGKHKTHLALSEILILSHDPSILQEILIVFTSIFNPLQSGLGIIAFDKIKELAVEHPSDSLRQLAENAVKSYTIAM